MNQITPDYTPDPDADRPIYTGLDWTGALPGKRPSWTAGSDTTPFSYFVLEVEDGRWEARAGFSDHSGRPAVTIGTFASDVIAMTAAERHDFGFWASTIRRGGQTPVFMGSPDHVADFITSIPDHEQDDVLDMIAGNFRLPDGESFATAASYFPATKSGLKQERNGSFTATFSIDKADVPMWMIQSNPGEPLVVAVAPTGGPSQDEWEERAANALKRSFALAADNTFHSWMASKNDRWGLIAVAVTKTSEEVEQAVSETLRRMIGCASRRDLARSRDAILRLEKIDREFYSDMSRGFTHMGADG